jgi:hypothetical protein
VSAFKTTIIEKANFFGSATFLINFFGRQLQQLSFVQLNLSVKNKNCLLGEEKKKEKTKFVFSFFRLNQEEHGKPFFLAVKVILKSSYA